MDQVLALRPFVPARDFDLSQRYYQALGFAVTLQDGQVAILKQESFSFILQNFYVKASAENLMIQLMIQLMVRDGDAWWRAADPARMAAEFDAPPPKPPAMQPWGM